MHVQVGGGVGEKMRTLIKTNATIMTIDLQGRDAPRIKRLRHAIKEGRKPSRWYDDDPADVGSLYRKRVIASVDVCADIIENSHDKELVLFAKECVSDFKEQLPKTFADWLSKRQNLDHR
jgi:hypothetical protein